MTETDKGALDSICEGFCALPDAIRQRCTDIVTGAIIACDAINDNNKEEK